MASDIIQNWAFSELKTVVATISIHTHAYTPHTHFQKKNFNSISKIFFSDIVYNVKNKIDFAKNRGAGPSGSPWIHP